MSHPEGEHHLLRDVTARAASDPAFRKKLLAEPAEAIVEAFGVEVPPGFRVRFIEKPADLDALIVLPDAPVRGAELDDDDLDAAAGGSDSAGAYW